MKIAHSADWHLGIVSWKTQKGVDRLAEQIEVLDFMRGELCRIKPDLIVIAGDLVHHRKSPSPEVLKELYSVLNDFRKIAPVVVVQGNHDWDGIALQNIFEIEDLHFLNGFKPIRVDTNSGAVKVYPLPYVSGVMDLKHGSGKTSEAVRGKLRDYVKDISRDPADSNVLVGHVMIEGYMPPTIENSMSFVLRRDFVSELFDYIALGHVHEFAELSNLPPTYYSGSIIQMDFSEEGQKKVFLVYDSETGGVEAVEFPHKELKTLDLSSFDSAKECLESIESSEGDYLRVVLDSRMSDIVVKLLENDRVVKVDFSRRESPEEIESLETDTQRFEELLEEYIKLEAGDERLEKKAIEVLRKILTERA